jgi:hypothetical protein
MSPIGSHVCSSRSRYVSTCGSDGSRLGTWPGSIVAQKSTRFTARVVCTPSVTVSWSVSGMPRSKPPCGCPY